MAPKKKDNDEKDKTEEVVEEVVEEAVEEVKEAVKEEIESAEVEADIDDDSIGVDIETEHIDADIDVNSDGIVDVSINNRKFSFKIKGFNKVLEWFFTQEGKVNKDRIGVTTLAIILVLTKLGIL